MTVALEALPADVAWEAPRADTRSLRSTVLVRTGGIDAAIAQSVAFGEARGEGWRAQVGLGAALFMGFRADGELTFDFETFDGHFVLPVDLVAGDWSARLEAGHASAHYGDGVRDNGDRPGNFDPWSREWLALRGARAIGPARVYAGARVLLHALPEAEPLAGQLGAEIVGPWDVAPFAAVDLQVAQEDAWAPALAGQAGVTIAAGPHELRVAAWGRTGPEDTGKLKPGTERWVGLVVGFDLFERGT
ncbi:MAG: DUF1207 domain-containing protein [Myxococcota bacterium]